MNTISGFVRMHVISQKKLRLFWETHPESKGILSAWFKIAERANWTNFQDVKRSFPQADQVGKFVVFNIGRKVRLIADIHYNRGKMFVRYVLTHKDYDKGKWKTD
jgi:mRNA interferase HigB